MNTTLQKLKFWACCMVIGPPVFHCSGSFMGHVIFCEGLLVLTD